MEIYITKETRHKKWSFLGSYEEVVPGTPTSTKHIVAQVAFVKLTNICTESTHIPCILNHLQMIHNT